jgi:hypothetical protein
LRRNKLRWDWAQITTTTTTTTTNTTTTTTYVRPVERSTIVRIAGRFDHPLFTGAVALLGWLAFVLIRLEVWGKGQISYFIGIGVVYANSARLPHGVHQVHSAGYDGQFYYRLALDPFNWHQTAYGITMDQPYRYTRIGYSVVVWALSLGRQAWVPAMLVVVNLIAVGAIAVLGGIFAREGGRSALWGLLFVAYFGMIISVGRDTAEPLAAACALGGLLCYRRGRHLGATALITYAVITRETFLLLAAAIAVTRLWGFFKQRAVRVSPQDLVWLVPATSYLALAGAEWAIGRGSHLGTSSDVARNLTAPFLGIIHALRLDNGELSFSHMGLADYNLLELVTLAAVVLAAVLVLGISAARVHERVAFSLFVLQALMASSLIWASRFGELRSLIETYLFAVLILLATPREQLPARRCIGWLAALVAFTLVVVARRRVLYQ